MRILTIRSILSILTAMIDIGVIWIVIYYAIKIVRNNARTIQIFKGIVILLLIKGVSSFLGLTGTKWLVDTAVNYGFLAIIIIFQPEIRALLERLGQSNTITRMTTLTGNELNDLVNALVESSVRLSKEKIGALMTIEQGQSMSDYIKTGTKINAAVTTELLCSIFVPLTPLHDGAVIIQGNRIACASAYFPPTNMDLPVKYGARHRAAIGISEVTDSTTIVISEETGTISIAEGGKLIHVDEAGLREYLLKVICVQEVEAQPKNKVRIKSKKSERGAKSGIKFDFLTPNEAPKENEELMNVGKSSKKTKSIDPSFAVRKKKNIATDLLASAEEQERANVETNVDKGGEENGK